VTAVRVLLATFALILSMSPTCAAKLKVVASFSILGDLATHIGGDRIDLRTLVGPNGDAHVFQPAPGEAKAVAQADVILLNGLGFEPWAERLIRSAAAKGRVVAVSEGVKAHPFKAQFGTSARAAIDPHAWQDLRNGEIYSRNIAAAFAAADKSNGAFYEANAASYVEGLAKLDAEIRAAFAAIPVDRRRVITSHDAFGYFGAAYAIEFIAPLGVSTEDQATAKGVARLIDQIRRDHITAIFVENITDPRLIAQIARETGVKIGGELFSDALSKSEGPAATYTDMFRHNAKALTAAMKAGL
jgi:zinc/manganese transport system substrate-binding protein